MHIVDVFNSDLLKQALYLQTSLETAFSGGTAINAHWNRQH